MRENLFLIALILLIILNIFVSYNLLKDDYYEKKQKIIQFLIIWLIPIIGGLIVLFFMNREEKTNRNSLESSNSTSPMGISESSVSGGD